MSPHSLRRLPTPRRPAALLCLAAAASVFAPSQGLAAEPDRADAAAAARARVVTTRGGTSTGRARDAARAALPLAGLSPAHRGQAAAILERHTLFRALPRTRFPIHPDALDYLVSHPDVSVALWRVMGISACELYQTGPTTYEADAKDGSVGSFEVVYDAPDQKVVLVNGQFKSPVLSDPIEATALFHLRVGSVRERSGVNYGIGEASLFVAFPSRAVGTAAKLVSPVTNVILDRNFEEVCLFAHLMDRSMRTRPRWVEEMAGQMTGVLPRRRGGLARLAGHVYAANQRRQQLRTAGR